MLVAPLKLQFGMITNHGNCNKEPYAHIFVGHLYTFHAVGLFGCSEVRRLHDLIVVTLSSSYKTHNSMATWLKVAVHGVVSCSIIRISVYFAMLSNKYPAPFVR